MEVIIDGHNLTIEEVVNVSRYHAKVRLSENCKVKIAKCRQAIDKLVKNKEVVYGLTTGFASFKNVAINADQTEQLQKNLIESHSVGVGNYFKEEIVRAAILVRINSLSQGYSGVRVVVVQTLIDMLNKGVYPCVPEKGSVGSSGDLAPLSHLMLVLMGSGEAFYKGKKISGKQAMKKAKISPLTLKSKEGLALNNGTAFMTGIAALATYDSITLAKTADISLALTMEAIEGIIGPFDKRIHEIRPHKGQIASAKNIRKLCEGSKAIKSQENNPRVQDSYSIRCSPQVHGASRDVLTYVKGVVETELNSTTDNPLIFGEQALSGGNFHGEPIAIAMDCLAIAMAEIGSVAERRISKMVDSSSSNGLPLFLIEKEKGGLNSGFMMPQYTAAALVSENKVLAHPASVDSIPTSANQEDHVSMGTIAARKVREIIGNITYVLSIELINSSQGIDLRPEGRRNMSPINNFAHKIIRSHVKHYDLDRPHYPDINKIFEVIHSRELLNKIENEFGNLD